jgi:predicted acetyltransferase
MIADYAFGSSPQERDTSKDAEGLPYLEQARAYVAFVDGIPQATATLWPMVQNIRGTLTPMSGVGAVATLPAARRKGLIRSLFATLYESMREHNEPVTTLYPFRESFYEKLGYAPMNQSKFVRFSPSTLAPLTRLEREGTTEQLTIRDGFDEWRAYLERYQTRVHGFALNDVGIAARVKLRNGRWTTFKISGYTGTLDADTFYYDSPEARLLLLEWFARHVDQVNEIKIDLAWDDLPEYWAADLYTRVVNHDEFFTTPMGRVLDVASLDGIGADTGSIAVEIVDPHCEWNAGVWTLTGEGGVLSVERGGSAEASLTIQGLSALVFAGQDPADFRLRGWGSPDASAQATLRGMFPRAFVRLHEQF